MKWVVAVRQHTRSLLLGLVLGTAAVGAAAQPGASSAASAATTTPVPAMPPQPAPVTAEPKLGFDPEDLGGAPAGGSSADGLSGVWAIMVKATVGLAAVLMLVYLTVGKGLGKLAMRQGTGRSMRVVDRVGLDPKKTLFLVDVEGVRTLVGVTDNAMAIMVLPPSPAPNVIKTSDAQDPLAPATGTKEGDA